MAVDLLSCIGTAKSLEKYFNSNEIVDIIAKVDLAAAAESFRKAKLSNYLREHYLSARNHLEHYVAAQHANLPYKYGGAYYQYHFVSDDKIFGLALISIIDFAIGDVNACRDDLEQIEEQHSLREEKDKFHSRIRPGGRIDLPYAIFATPRGLYRTFVSEPPHLSDPVAFCKQMRTLLDKT